ncbi:MAG: hypothetical protein CTY34_06315 [Methylobacter sp.]|nr:MAG: hypothetical protein CTY34_06315 [Methylobacter sp.]PPD28240.1 MAG: hypothetical protein CTY21_13220 [Methylomonas sp.]
MPLYDYHCEHCGPFAAFRKMAESHLPAACIACGSNSARVISAPHYALLGKAQRMAHERNEQSAHAPKVRQRSGCGCTGAHTCNTGKAAPAAAESPVFKRQTKVTARPWMLGH